LSRHFPFLPCGLLSTSPSLTWLLKLWLAVARIVKLCIIDLPHPFLTVIKQTTQISFILLLSSLISLVTCRCSTVVRQTVSVVTSWTCFGKMSPQILILDA
jgi:hypothetical protein